MIDRPKKMHRFNEEMISNENIKSLVIYINEYLKWETHMNHLGKKFNQI